MTNEPGVHSIVDKPPIMKIIFLDIDGVLNSNRYFEKNPQVDLELDTEATQRLAYICKNTGAKVVISSTWRKNYMDTLIPYFKQFDIEIIGRTSITNHCDCCVRGNLIHQWIKDNDSLLGVSYYNYNNYVIIDDDSDMLYWQRNNFVNTNNKVGLTNRDVHKAIKILNKKYKERRY